jgi:hypothetical protein
MQLGPMDAFLDRFHAVALAVEAQALLEKHANHLVEKYFGVIEGGSGERRLTIRLPINLARRVEEAATGKNLSVNAHAMRALESAVTKDGHPVIL